MNTLAHHSNSRNIFMDCLKGYAIYLVVLGHAIQTFDTDWKTNPLSIAIYMFHMPLFIAISGYFSYSSITHTRFRILLKRRFVQIMVPSLTMGIINVLLIGGGKFVCHKPMDVLYFTNLLFTGMWFLTALYVLTVLGSIIHKCFKGGICYYVMWFAIYLIICLLPNVWVVNNVEFLLPFYVVGIMTRKIMWNHLPLWLVVIGVCVFSISFLHYDFDCSMYAMDGIGFGVDYVLLTLFRFTCGISGIIVSIMIVKVAVKFSLIKNVIAMLGTVTLPIYVMHQKILMINNFITIRSDLVLFHVIVAICLSFITIKLYVFLRRPKIIALLFFGENKYIFVDKWIYR